MDRTRGVAVACSAVAVLLTVATAQAGATALQKCEAGKNGVAGKYASCLLKARQKYVIGGETNLTGYNDAVLKCEGKYAAKWQSLEGKAGMGGCPTMGDEADIRDFLDACALTVEDALGGAALPSDVLTCNEDLTTCNEDLTTCEGDLAACVAAAVLPVTGQTTCYDTVGAVLDCPGTGQDGELQRGAARSFTDNGDGTITDNVTGLTWEKLSDDGSIHDRDAVYSWGDAFASKVNTLNSTNFASHDDWRVPNSFELYSLLHLGAWNPAAYSVFDSGCVEGCDVTTCSCTAAAFYWSSSAYLANPEGAWIVGFDYGNTLAYFKGNTYRVRAVRGGS